MDAIWKYYFDSTLFSFGTSLVIGLLFGLFWSVVIFALFGSLIGRLGFECSRSEQYYFYYNLGYTKKSLMLLSWKINLLFAAPIFLIALF